VPADVFYPDLTAPAGWPYHRQGLQIRVVPPGATLDTAEATIVISPLVARLPTTPPPEELVENAIFAEQRLRLEVSAQKGPTKAKAASGLEGISLEITAFVRPAAPIERRVYVMYADALCYYAVSYLAWEATFERHVEAFWATARSVRPFRGRHLAPSGPSPLGMLYSD
jgi:hypothetical protein